ncbi:MULTISPECIES: MFS transporter [unclassified Streptomyces]|uniref:MFS transporter n=1 Tax=unclassified Streptomyces TaxID=2593676 RepID=UPI00136CE920|nr:MFS transporter [Streptomyces sp. SID335]MYZ13713.1 MFS transporter [Streptomyces sp. SID337]NDZ90110.1 MFS transporter [Streptomyces sp. SID10115]NDZ99182.1 MFS transporter [Streptomyces sp. SID10116]NEB50098.1 MFS transporter [Streptomyces sp. SID339]
MTEPTPPNTSLWRNRNYRTFLVIQTLSALGDSFSFVAIPLLVLHSTGSVVQMGLVTGLTGVASIVTGLFAGVIADRFDRRRLLMLADMARCLLYALIPLVWLHATPMWLIYTVVPLTGGFAMLFQVTYVTVVPAIVEPGQIIKANAHLYGSYAVATVGGPTLAGLVAAAFGPVAAIGIDAATFAVSAAGLLLVKLRPTPRPIGDKGAERERGAERGGVRGEFLAGFRFLWAHPVLRPLTVLLSLFIFLTHGMTDVLIFRIKEDLGHGDGTVGYVLSAGTIGTFLASFLVTRVRKRLGFGTSWVGAVALAGIAVACLGLTGSVPVIGALSATMLLATGVAGICSMSLRQEVTPGHLLGRVTAAFWTTHYSLGPLGAAAVTAAAAGFGVAEVCLSVGAGVVCVALSGTLTGIVRAESPEASSRTAASGTPESATETA